MTTVGPAIKLTVFGIVTSLITAVLAMELTDFSFRDRHSYHAVFDDVSGLEEGEAVRVAGVTVGQVTNVSVYRTVKSKVTFTVQSSRPLVVGTRALVRYKNLIGDRYLEITQGKGANQRLQPGGVIPNAQTEPALDLTALFNGFKPLLRGLSPNQVNKLTGELIAVLQGRGGTVEELLAHIASLGNTLADHDRVVGEVINNLNTVLATLDKRGGRLSSLIARLQRLISGLAADRKPVGQALERINAMTSTLADLLINTRPTLAADIYQLGRLSKSLDQNKQVIDKVLKRLPKTYRLIGRIGSYGAWFNFYLCSIRVKLTGPGGKPVYLPAYKNDARRCQPR